MDVKERLRSLKKHLENAENQVAAEVPSRQKNREAAYREWLKLEIKRTKSKIDKLSS